MGSFGRREISLAARFFCACYAPTIVASLRSKRGASRTGEPPTVRPRTAGPLRLPWIPALLIVAAGFVAYSNSFGGILVFDDEPAIARNPNLRTLWPLAVAMEAPPDTTLSGRPIASLSFALDYAVTGGSLAGYHRTNLLIHLTTALLLFGLTRRTLLTPPLEPRFGARSTALALTIALVFVVHPLQTGSVTYIVQRVESLMGLFYLATLYFSIRALHAETTGARGFTSAAIGACALGMATKEVMVTAPLMVMLWDRTFASGPRASRKRLYAGLLSTWLILAVIVAGGHRSTSVGFGFPEWPWWRYLMTQPEVVLHYLRLALAPTPLVLDYQWPAAASVGDVAMSAVTICVLLLLTAFGLVRRSPAAFTGVWFFLILAPSSSVIPIVTEVAAEHRMYLPVAGVITPVVLGLYRLVPALSASAGFGVRRFLRASGFLGAAATVAGFAWMSHERNADYHDYDRIWSDTIAKRPGNARARNNYASSLLAQNRFAEAEVHLKVAVDQQPAFPEAQANLGVALSAQGKLDEGIDHLRRSLALKPGFAGARRNLGEAYALQRRMGEAAAEYEKALELLPDDVELLNRTAWILATAVDERARVGARARAMAERAVRLTQRRDPVSLDSLGAALAELGDFPAALRATQEAQALSASNPNFGRELEVRARLYAQGRPWRDR